MVNFPSKILKNMYILDEPLTPPFLILKKNYGDTNFTPFFIRILFIENEVKSCDNIFRKKINEWYFLKIRT